MMGIIITCAIICIFRKKNNSSILWTVCCRKATKSDQDLEALIRNYVSLAPKRYSLPKAKDFKSTLVFGQILSVNYFKLDLVYFQFPYLKSTTERSWFILVN